MPELKRVLLIDDDELSSELISEILNSAGYITEICHTTGELYDSIKKQEYDIFIVDLLLGSHDGIEIIRELRQKYPVAIIFTLTGLNASENLSNAMKAGADHFFNKPIKADNLLKKISELETRILHEKNVFNFNDIVSKAFNTSSNPVFITDRNGDLYYANNHFLDVSGLAASRIKRYNLYSLRFDNAPEFDKLINRRYYKHVENRSLESRFIVDKGEEIWYNVIINPVQTSEDSEKYFFLFQLFDITKKKQMDNFILSNEEKFRSFISLSNDGMALINEEGLVIEWNSSMSRITGVNMKAVYGEKFWDILKWVKIDFDNESLDQDLERNIKYALKYGMKNESRIENVSQITHNNGQLVYIQYSLFTIRMDSGFRLGLVVRDNTATVLSQQKIAAQNEELSQAYVNMEKLARIDPLTQLANRRDIEIRLNYEKRRVTRHHNNLSIAIGDIDDFKHFNDTYGHDMGDFVLVEIARIMSEAIREQDIIGRWGGEEFILVFPETPADGGFTICNRLRENIEKHNFEFKGESLSVRMTIGLSEYRGSEKMKDTIKRADIALYQGKKSGKNCVVTN